MANDVAKLRAVGALLAAGPRLPRWRLDILKSGARREIRNAMWGVDVQLEALERVAPRYEEIAALLAQEREVRFTPSKRDEAWWRRAAECERWLDKCAARGRAGGVK